MTHSRMMLLTALIVAGVAAGTPAARAQTPPCGEQLGCGADCGACGGCQGGGGCHGSGCKTAGYDCIDGPTPGPCTADGVCYPKRSTWGHYKGKWNRWPGDYDDPVPVFEKEADQEGLPPVIEPIDPTVEDLQAPPPSDAEAEEEAAESEGPSVGDSLPPLPPARPLGAPAPPAAAPQGDDPPPALPPLPGFNRPIRNPPPAAGGGFSGTPRTPRGQRVADDLPPSLPASFGAVIPAAATLPQGPRVVAPIGVVPAPAIGSPAR